MARVREGVGWWVFATGGGQLADGGGQLADGGGQLADGGGQLADGGGKDGADGRIRLVA
ncbi:hypothetical protein [Amycolatopsis acidicola]|uniref:hypothetical protein n=1 Tax=Amycolatopsis acidicola TaxID=2596893 RepID=UPI003C7D6083